MSRGGCRWVAIIVWSSAAVACGSSAAEDVAPRPTTAVPTAVTDLLSPGPEATVPVASTTSGATEPETVSSETIAPTDTTEPPNSVVLPKDAKFTDPRDATSEVTDLLRESLPAPDRDTVRTALRDALTSRLEANGCDLPPTMQLSFSGGTARAPVLVATAAFGCDDSVGGVRYRVTLGGSNSAGWTVTGATREDLCLRGTDGTLCT